MAHAFGTMSTWQIMLFFGPIATPLVTICSKCINYIHSRQYDKVAAIILLIAVLTGSFTFYQNYQNEQFRLRGSGTIPASSLVVKPWVNTNGLGDGSQYFEFPSGVC